jgi:hypothetical protein
VDFALEKCIFTITNVLKNALLEQLAQMENVLMLLVKIINILTTKVFALNALKKVISYNAIILVLRIKIY